jgi:hypothetical protein
MMSSGSHKFFRLIKHPLKSTVFFLTRLPSAYFSGIQIGETDENKCTVSVPYKWFSRNPFGSTYFACLSMAAEMSTGVLAMMHTYQRRPSVSMLVVKMESEYFKKATAATYFTCENGLQIQAAIDMAIATGEPQACVVQSTGVNKRGEQIALFSITWSFKARKG